MKKNREWKVGDREAVFLTGLYKHSLTNNEPFLHSRFKVRCRLFELALDPGQGFAVLEEELHKDFVGPIVAECVHSATTIPTKSGGKSPSWKDMYFTPEHTTCKFSTGGLNPR